MEDEEIKPNNSEKNNPKTHCLDVEIVKDRVALYRDSLNNEANLNKNNLNNLNNLTNLNNLNSTYVLDKPENKTEFIFYYLYDNGEQNAEDLVNEAGLSSIDSFNTLKNRNKDKIVISRKAGTKNYYNLSEDFREQLKLRIKQATEQKERIEQNKADEEKRQKEENATQEELLIKVKDMINDKSIFSFENGEFKLDCEETKQTYPEVFELLINTPLETRRLIEIAISEKELGDCPIRFINLNTITNLNIEDYRAKHLGKGISTEGKVVTMSSIRPLITSAKFECSSCGTIISMLQIEKKYKEPSRCSCGRRGGFKELSKDTIDGAFLIIEDLEPKSQIPVNKSMTCFVSGKLLEPGEVEKLTPGNNIRVFGELKEIPVTTAGGAMLTRLDLALEVIDVEEFDPELNSIDFNEEDIEECEELASKIDREGLSPLIESYAPDVEGYEMEKRALAIQGVQKENSPGRENTTGHIGIFGNPGKGKTVLAKYAVEVTQGSKYSSCGGSTGVGITAATVKEDQIGWVLKLGLLPLTRKLVVLDEYNLQNDEDKPKTQEAMSEAQISINKAGISASPRVPCGILALANPERGVFDDLQPLTKQFGLTPQQLNRFDALFVESGKNTPEMDDKIADIILKRKCNEIKPEFDVRFLRKFFTYSKLRKEPILTSESKAELKKYYKKAVELTKNQTSSLINPRFLNALIRFAVGHAKLRGSVKVLPKDVEVAYSILSASYLNLNKYVA